MIDEERLSVFLNSFYPGNTPYLEQLEKRCVSSGVPVIRRETQSVLRFLLEMKKPETVLEIGTAVGFSAVFFCTYSAAAVTTIENWEPRFYAAEETFRSAGVEERVTFLKGDALEILPRLEGVYDFIFMDAAKGRYRLFWPEIRRLLSQGGILAADNVLQEGELLESRFAVERRARTIHFRMREYLHEVSGDEDFVTTILPAGDGIALTVRKH